MRPNYPFLRIPLLGFLALLLLCGACGREESITLGFPPPLVYFEPNLDETIAISEDETQSFMMLVTGGRNLEYSVHVASPQIGLADSLVAEANTFIFDPCAFNICWPFFEETVIVSVRMCMKDGGYEVEHVWELAVEMVPGPKFNVQPPDTNLVVPAGLPVLFRMEVENVEEEIFYKYYLDQSFAGSLQDYYFMADQLGDYEIAGHAWWHGPEADDRYFTWYVSVEPGDDQEPPDAVEDLRIGPGLELGEVEVAFTAPRDNPDNDFTYRYELRWFEHEVLAENWESTYLAELLDVVPGVNNVRLSFDDPAAGDSVYCRVKSYDRAGNCSEWSNLAACKARGFPVRGFIFDAETGEGISDLQVIFGYVPDVTDAGGEFHCPNVRRLFENHSLPPGKVVDEDLHAPPGEPNIPEYWGDWFDLGYYRPVLDSLDLLLPMLRTRSFGLDNYDDDIVAYMHHVLRSFSTLENSMNNNGHLVRPEYPVRVLVPDVVNNEIDYGELTRNAMAIWEEDCGLDLFTEVSEPEDTQLYFHFATQPDTSGSGIYTVREYDHDTFTVLRAGIDIVANSAAPDEYQDNRPNLQRVILHEMGHALGIRLHSYETDHVMNTTNTEDRPHEAEIYLLRCIYHIEPWTYISFFIKD